MKLADDGGALERRRQVPVTRWQERTAVKGGPAVHAVARAGWAAGGALGAVLAPAVVALSGALGGAGAGAVLAVLAVLVISGAVPGAVLGALAQHGARAWLCAPTEREREAERRVAARAERLDAADLDPDGRWAGHYRGCASAVTSFHELVDTIPEGPGRRWLVDIGDRLDAELDEALRLARLGQQLERGEPAGDERDDVERIAERLRSAEADFAATTQRATRIAVDAAAETGLERLHAELDVLAAQAPQLRLPRGPQG
ncbi:hypothetical protein [Haloechinothrix sp. LS1_15]|uniref:hypothetical protein n=1 Tax=Haloechinothrix sp. LS1_15 TaxID=2652248 RepID=UPI0029478A4D|nr:hypothetical protein [Haloechinothrix sp. LS1_15]MDV6013016.1 hypothetical protein [Haloechinothrix sp. LS1_15]